MLFVSVALRNVSTKFSSYTSRVYTLQPPPLTHKKRGDSVALSIGKVILLPIINLCHKFGVKVSSLAEDQNIEFGSRKEVYEIVFNFIMNIYFYSSFGYYNFCDYNH